MTNFRRWVLGIGIVVVGICFLIIKYNHSHKLHVIKGYGWGNPYSLGSVGVYSSYKIEDIIYYKPLRLKYAKDFIRDDINDKIKIIQQQLPSNMQDPLVYIIELKTPKKDYRQSVQLTYLPNEKINFSI